MATLVKGRDHIAHLADLTGGAVKLRWESDGTSHSVTGASGHRYEIVLIHDATEWGVKGAPKGWCLKADGDVVQFDTSLRQCKKAANLLEKRASLF